jgi:hypothetical protein
MNNSLPLRYEKIEQNLEKQWESWRGNNGLVVTIYGSRVDCLKDWRSLNADAQDKSHSRAVYHGKLNKKIFMESPNGYWFLFTQAPFEYLQLLESRDKQWSNFKKWNGYKVLLFQNIMDLVIEKNVLLDEF